MISFLQMAIRSSMIFLFGATGETITEKSGNLNLGIPGIMCVGAVGGCLGESAYLATVEIYEINGLLAVGIPIICAMLAAAAMGAIYCFLTVTLRCNQNVTGLTIATFGAGIYLYCSSAIDRTNYYYASQCFTTGLPFAKSLGAFGELFFSYGILVYLAIAIAIVTSIILKRTRTGLNLRSIGENPATADAAGINVTAYKYVATCTGSAVAGLGGLFYIMDYLDGSWEYDLSALGWMAVALVIFSMWKTDWGILGSILFGALYIAPHHMELGFAQRELVKMIPYVVTIIVLIVTSILNKKENQAPTALGVTYFREDR